MGSRELVIHVSLTLFLSYLGKSSGPKCQQHAPEEARTAASFV